VTLHMTLAADGTSRTCADSSRVADRGFVTIVERQAAPGASFFRG